MLDDILLLSGNDIPFFSANVSIYQPKIKEIAYIGEENFFIACELLSITKETIKEKEADIDLDNIDNFDLLIAIISQDNSTIQKTCLNMLLTLLFPTFNITIKEAGFYLVSDEISTVINKDNYDEFQKIVKRMFESARSKSEDQFEYKPADKKAREIAEKLKGARNKLAKMKGEDKVSVFSKYISILSVGLQKDINSLLNYTVFQLFDEFKRYQLYQAFEMNLKARLAGATGLDDVENWMENIHPD